MGMKSKIFWILVKAAVGLIKHRQTRDDVQDVLDQVAAEVGEGEKPF